MKFLITGATGLVGKRLVEELFVQGHGDVRVLTRNKAKAEKSFSFPVKPYEWNPDKNEIEAGAMDDVDVVIHLAGESVAEGRWSTAKKDRIMNSRVNGTNLVMDAIAKANNGPKKLVSTSAIGIYGDRGNEELPENATQGDGFLADVCKKWEGPVLNHNIDGLKTHIIRVGIVLSTKGGALVKMIPPFKAGVGGILGNGKQYMSWIHIDDLVNQFIHLATNDVKPQVFNGVTPTPVTNYQFTKILGKALSRPTIFPVPAFAIKILFGEMSQILLNSQNVKSDNFNFIGYEFKYSKLEDALEELFHHEKKGEELLIQYQWLAKKPSEVFHFFSDEKNLEKITPKYLNFKVNKSSTPSINTGTLIDYSLSLHGIPFSWKTRINDFQNEKSFIDEQIKGPYSKWVHTHEFIPVGEGTLMKDEVVYKLPMGLLGKLVAGFFVKKDLNNIFSYRKETIYKIFA